MQKAAVVAYIKSHNLIGIKAGAERPSFLDIWRVVVNDRIFARSWGLAEKSWFNTFLQNPHGQIKCGDDILPIKAEIPTDIASLTDKINAAYLAKYNSAHNIPYAKGIVQEKHIDKTMEFIIEMD